MLESGDSFATFVRRYRLERSEGLVLRYLTDAWRTLDRSLPDDVYTDALEDVVEWLGELIRATDATLLDEWTLLAGAPGPRPPRARGAGRRAAVAAARRGAPRCARRRSAGSSCWPTRSLRGAGRAQRVDRGASCAEAMAPYWAEYDAHRHRRRCPVGAPSSTLAEEPDRWVVTQRLADPAGDGEWRFVAAVDLELARAEGAPTLQLESLGPFTPR